jgi:hypothetical protein
MVWAWTLLRYWEQGMDNLCFVFLSDYPSALLNGRGVILLEGSVGEDRLMVLDDGPQRVLPPSGHSSGLLDADFSALWVSEDNRSEFGEDGTEEYCNNFSDCLSPEPLWHAGDLLVGHNYEISANSEDESFTIDNLNSPPLSFYRGWSPDTFTSQEKPDNPCMGTTQSPYDPKVRAALTALSVLLTAFQISLDPLNREVVLNSPTSSCKSLIPSGDNHLNNMTVKTYNVTSKLDD